MDRELKDVSMTDEWAKSTYCTTAANCVETRATHEGADVRDSKDTGREHIAVGREAWRAFVAGLKK